MAVSILQPRPRPRPYVRQHVQPTFRHVPPWPRPRWGAHGARQYAYPAVSYPGLGDLPVTLVGGAVAVGAAIALGALAWVIIDAVSKPVRHEPYPW